MGHGRAVASSRLLGRREGARRCLVRWCPSAGYRYTSIPRRAARPRRGGLPVRRSFASRRDTRDGHARMRLCRLIRPFPFSSVLLFSLCALWGAPPAARNSTGVFFLCVLLCGRAIWFFLLCFCCGLFVFVF